MYNPVLEYIICIYFILVTSPKTETILPKEETTEPAETTATASTTEKGLNKCIR